jgi:hypothetical protein
MKFSKTLILGTVAFLIGGINAITPFITDVHVLSYITAAVGLLGFINRFFTNEPLIKTPDA